MAGDGTHKKPLWFTRIFDPLPKLAFYPNSFFTLFPNSLLSEPI